jgi:hypothetical protein
MGSLSAAPRRSLWLRAPRRARALAARGGCVLGRIVLGWAALAGLSRPLSAWPAGRRVVLCVLGHEPDSAQWPVSKIEILFYFHRFQFKFKL